MPEVADLPCFRQRDGHIYATFEPTDDERRAIAAGANIRLGVHVEPIPPVSLDPDYTRCAECRAVYVRDRAKALGFRCGHCDGVLD